MSRILTALLFTCLLPAFASAADDQAVDAAAQEKQVRQHVDSLDKPLYTPFVERYVLDELKQLRIDQAKNKQELTEKIVDRQYQAIDRAVSYSTDTVTYFFYIIAAATSVLVLVGWTSIRDIKERVQSIADEEISKLITEYEGRLESIENQLQQKTQHIEENRGELELLQEIQSLWLRAQQETSAATKIDIYDRILKLRHDDCEALTYKADAVLELNEPQWAINLCNQALKVDPDNSHAFYQLACAYASIQQPEEAVHYLREAIKRRESFRDEVASDPALASLHGHRAFEDLIHHGEDTTECQ